MVCDIHSKGYGRDRAAYHGWTGSTRAASCPGENEQNRKRQQAEGYHLSKTCDPFGSQASDYACLLNIATGRAASKETHQYLTGTLSDGRELHQKFKDECATDCERFMRPIQRRPVSNFAKENAKKKSPNVKGKPADSLRDAFIRILVAISRTTNFNPRHTMAFPIIDYPLSLTHSDGSMLKTEKGVLLKKLEEPQEGFTERPLPPINVTLIDGGLFIHSSLSAMGNITTYENLARSLLDSVCKHPGNEIHVLFDTYRPMSLKASERKLRGAEERPYVIIWPIAILKTELQEVAGKWDIQG